MRRFVIPGATVLLLTPAVAPAAADTVSLQAACEQTRAALATTGGTSDTTRFAGSRFAVGTRVVEAGAGTYGVLAQEGLRAKDRKAALKYLKAPGAKVWFNSGQYFGTHWTSSYDQALADASGLPTDCAATAGGLLSSSGTTYTYAGASVDIVGGAVTRWDSRIFTFGPQSISVPTGITVSYGAWAKASQAASLDATMRTISRTVAQTVSEPTLDAIDSLMRASVDPDRAVPLKVRMLRAGTLVSARNPYTKTYHAWRVYLKDGEPTARRVAP